MKNKATYDPTKTVRLETGTYAIVWPTSHYSPLVSCTKHILTSIVIAIEPDGTFETENTIYTPSK